MSRQAGNMCGIAHLPSVNGFLSTLKSKEMETFVGAVVALNTVPPSRGPATVLVQDTSPPRALAALPLSVSPSLFPRTKDGA